MAFLGVLSGPRTRVVAASMAVVGLPQLGTGGFISGAHAFLTAIVAAGLRRAIAGPKS